MIPLGSGLRDPRSLRTKRCTVRYPPLKPYWSTRSCHIALALRPRFRPSWIVSRNGSHVLADGFALGSSIGIFCEKGLIKSVITPAPLAGFESLESVITSLAGFAGDRRPQLPDGRTPIP